MRHRACERVGRPAAVRRRTALAVIAAGALAPTFAPARAAAQAGAKTVIDIRIENRRVVAPTGAVRVSHNDEVVLRWTVDEEVEIHLHGYDVLIRLRPGAPSSMALTARATGRFPITSHGWGAEGHGHDALTYLEVYPR